MSEQETLFKPPEGPAFNPEDHHLWPRFVDDAGLHINTLAWNRARAERSFVGTCRHCGGYLLPEPTDAFPPSPDDPCTVWLSAVCVTCDHEFVSPDGKVLQRSARHSRMPRTFLRTRSGVIAPPRSEGG